MNKTFDVLLGFIEASEPFLKGYRSCGAFERAQEYKRYEKIRKERRKKAATCNLPTKDAKAYRQYYKTVKYLTDAQYISYKKGEIVELTEKGWKKCISAFAQGYVKLAKTGKRVKKRDCHYIIIFDIPENKRRLRELLRKCMVNIGFKLLQKSIYVTRDPKAYRDIQLLIEKSGLKKIRKIYRSDSYCIKESDT